MVPFIADRIMKDANKSEKQGQEKYRAYFIKTKMYVQFKEEVDTILRTDGYASIIVEE